jgi:hypothetical protein
MKKQIFISYRQESIEHARAVRRLGELLRKSGIPVVLDQFLLDEYPGGPDSGWPKWCEDNANDSACILIIASEGWFAAYNKTEQHNVGFGAATEADLFRQALWDEKGENARIRLAFLHEIDSAMVPVRLRTWHQFYPFTHKQDLDRLISWIAGCLGLINVELPTVHWPESIVFEPDLANRNLKEWPAIVELLGGRSRERILLYEGDSGLGKSHLIRQASSYAKTLGIPVVRIDLKSDASINGILGMFDLDLGEHLPNFSLDGAKNVHLLRKDLRNLRVPVLIIVDSYDEKIVINKSLADWFSQQILSEVETALSLAVIVAGQKLPDFTNSGWRDLAKHFPLAPITEIEHWKCWVDRRYPGLHLKGDLLTIVKAAAGNPMIISNLCEGLHKSQD